MYVHTRMLNLNVKFWTTSPWRRQLAAFTWCWSRTTWKAAGSPWCARSVNRLILIVADEIPTHDPGPCWEPQIWTTVRSKNHVKQVCSKGNYQLVEEIDMCTYVYPIYLQQSVHLRPVEEVKERVRIHEETGRTPGQKAPPPPPMVFTAQLEVDQRHLWWNSGGQYREVRM